MKPELREAKAGKWHFYGLREEDFDYTVRLVDDMIAARGIIVSQEADKARVEYPDGADEISADLFYYTWRNGLRRLPVQAVQDDLCGPDSVGPPPRGLQRLAERVHGVRLIVASRFFHHAGGRLGSGLMRASPLTNGLLPSTGLTPLEACFLGCFSTLSTPQG